MNKQCGYAKQYIQALCSAVKKVGSTQMKKRKELALLEACRRIGVLTILALLAS